MALCLRMTQEAAGVEKTALPDENAAEAVCGSHLQSGLDNRVVEITAVAPDHECGARAFRPYRRSPV